MKKMISLILCLALVCCLFAGCAAKTADDTTTPADAELLRAALGGLLRAAAHSDDLCLRDLRIHIEMLLRDHPCPEQSDADGIHK